MKTTVDLVEKLVNNFSNLVVNEIKTNNPDCDNREKGYLETEHFLGMMLLKNKFGIENENMSNENMSFVFEILKQSSKVMPLTVDDVIAILEYTDKQIYLSYMFLVVMCDGDSDKINDKLIAEACAKANALEIEDVKSYLGYSKDEKMDTFMFNPVAYLSIIPFDRDFDFLKVKAVLSEEEPVEIVSMLLNIDGETENLDEDGDSKISIFAIDCDDENQKIFCFATVNGKVFDMTKLNIKFKMLEFNEKK